MWHARGEEPYARVGQAVGRASERGLVERVNVHAHDACDTQQIRRSQCVFATDRQLIAVGDQSVAGLDEIALRCRARRELEDDAMWRDDADGAVFQKGSRDRQIRRQSLGNLIEAVYETGLQDPPVDGRSRVEVIHSHAFTRTRRIGVAQLVTR